MLSRRCRATLKLESTSPARFAASFRFPHRVALDGTFSKRLIVVAVFRLGLAAVEAMMHLIRGEKIQTKRLPAEIIGRQSTAPPARV